MVVYSAKHREYQLVAKQGVAKGALPPPPRKLSARSPVLGLSDGSVAEGGVDVT